jgi:hypothetical protein
MLERVNSKVCIVDIPVEHEVCIQDFKRCSRLMCVS